MRVNSPTSINLLVEGIEQDCAAPKELHAGWNWVGAPCAITPTATALQSITSHYQRVLSLDKTYDPALPQFSTLTQLTPGQGYLIYITSPVTLTYPSTRSDEQLPVDEFTCLGVSPTPYATLIYGEIASSGLALPAGSLVEFLTPRGEVAGCSRVTESGLLPLTQVYGAMEEGDIGFSGGEQIYIRINRFQVVEPVGYWHDDRTPNYVNIDLGWMHYFFPLMQR